MNTRSFLQLIFSLLLALPTLAQDPPADAAPPDQEKRERQMAHLRQTTELKRRIDLEVAQLDNPLGSEFRDLVGNPDLTFEQMRRLAELREHLSRLAAPELVAALQRLRAQFHPRPGRPGLTDEQKEGIREHHATLQQAQVELNGVLVAADESGEYARLLAAEERPIEKQRRLGQLRRELIAGSRDAQAKIREIHQLNTAFQDAHPNARTAPARLVSHTVSTIKRNVNAIQTLEEQIDSLLADANKEYASLLDNDELSEAQADRLAELRISLTPDVPGAADLARSIHHLRHSIREKKVRMDRMRHRLEHRDGSGPREAGRAESR
ncbi:MAG: hypothetical protein ACI8W8_001293 [Rhodothermales bacterium]|jgi:hypothetical protein